MKTAIYFHYTTRSLRRGGQRTFLAIFCIVIGVMAIVSLQLVGQMINLTLASNVRDANGGDIAVKTPMAPITQDDLAFFTQLKQEDIIADYTSAFTVEGSTSLAAASTQSFTLQVVDPQTFPVVTPPLFLTPDGATLSNLLQRNQVVVDQNVLDQLHKHVGDAVDVHVTTNASSGLLLHTKIAGVVKNSGVFTQTQDFMVISIHDYQLADGNTPLLYDTVDIATTSSARTNMAISAIQHKFRLASVVTADQTLKNNQGQVDLIKRFLEVAGLLALLIGGIGIVNTMQVQLSRRKLEIAMLKTSGYLWFDLYLLFGLEAGLLG